MDKAQVSQPYQWSIKLDNGEIFVIHVDTLDELKEKREELMTFISSIKRTPVKEEPDEDFEEAMDKLSSEGFCEIHRTRMDMKEGKYGSFFSHSRGKYPDIQYCSGKGFK